MDPRIIQNALGKIGQVAQGFVSNFNQPVQQPVPQHFQPINYGQVAQNVGNFANQAVQSFNTPVQQPVPQRVQPFSVPQYQNFAQNIVNNVANQPIIPSSANPLKLGPTIGQAADYFQISPKTWNQPFDSTAHNFTNDFGEGFMGSPQGPMTAAEDLAGLYATKYGGKVLSAGKGILTRIGNRLQEINPSNFSTPEVQRALAGEQGFFRIGQPGTQVKRISDLTSYEPAVDRKAVELYKQRILAGEPVDPIYIKRDSSGNLGVEDGKHRLQAYKELGVAQVPTVELKPTPIEQAKRYLQDQSGKIKLGPSPTQSTGGVEGGVKQLRVKPNSIDAHLQDIADAVKSGNITPEVGQLLTESANTLRVKSSVSSTASQIKSTVGQVQQPELISEFLGGRKNQLGQTTGQKGSSVGIVAPKQVSGLQQFFNRARNIISSQGPAGQELARRLQSSRDLAETTAGSWVSKLPTVRDLSKSEFNNFVDVAEGNAKPLSTKIAQAAQEWAGVRSEIYNTAKSTGLDIGQLENYFPHNYDPKMFQGDNFVKAVQHLVATGQAKSTDEAAQLLRHAQDVIRNRRQGNLETERMVNLPGYEKTKDALFNYIGSASNRIAQVKHFGPNDSLAMQLINRVSQEGGDASTVKNLFDTSVGAKQYGELQSKVSKGLRAFNTVTKLGLGALTNAGQSVNTASVVGGVRTLLTTPKAMFSQEAKDFALKAGTTLDSVIQDLREGSGLSGGMLGKIGAPGFNIVEKFNRTLASVAGRDYARELASKGDTKALAKMGINLVGTKLTPEQEIQAARNIVERTQFKVDPQDLPGWSSSPWGKVLTQFKSFSYNQSAFLGRELIGPALQGNVTPLVRFLAIGIPVGMGIQTAKNVLRNRKDEENPAKRVLQGFNQSGGLGLGGDITTGLFPMNGKYLDANRATTLALSTLGGPTVGNAIDLYGGLSQAVQGKPANLERSIVRDIPVVGPTVQNTVLPYKAANGDVNRRVDLGVQPTQSTDQKQPQAISKPTSDYTPLEIAQIKKQISQLSAKEKQIISQNGFLGFGTTPDTQKNQQLLDIQAQQDALNSKLKQATPEYKAQQLSKAQSLTDTQYTLDAQRAQRASDLGGWLKASNTQLQSLQDYQKTLDPAVDKARINSLQNQIEDLQVAINKYKSYGGFTKPRKGRRLSVSKGRVKKYAVKQVKLKIKKVRLAKFKPSTLKIKAQKPIKLKIRA